MLSRRGSRVDSVLSADPEASLCAWEDPKRKPSAPPMQPSRGVVEWTRSPHAPAILAP